MKNQLIFGALIAASTLAVMPAHAGFLDKLVDKVGNKVENVVSGKVAKKAGDKAGEATDAVINPEPDAVAPEQATNEKQNDVSARPEPPATNPLGGVGGLGGMLKALQQKVTIEDSYVFDLTMNSEITSGSDANVMVQSYSADAFHMKIDSNQSIILDMKNEAMIMIDEKAKTKSPMSSQLMKQAAKMGGANVKKKMEDSVSLDRLKETGETKDILGYKANQWTYSNGRDSGEIWVTEEIEFDFIGFSKNLMSMFDSGNGQFLIDYSKLQGKYPNGLPLETTNYVDGKVDSSMKVTAVSQKAQRVDLSSYKEQSMLGQ